MYLNRKELEKTELEYKMLRFVYWVCIILFLFISISITDASGNDKTVNSSSVILVKDKLLTVNVKDILLKKVLIEIANQEPITIVLFAPAEELIVAAFSGLPVEKGLKRLLRDFNYTFIYDNSEKSKGSECKIKEIAILSRLGESQSRRAEPMIISSEGPTHESLSEDLRNEDLDKSEEIESEFIVDSVRDMLQDEDAEVRLMLVEEIATIGGPTAIQALQSALEDEDEEVRKMAEEKLRQLKGELE